MENLGSHRWNGKALRTGMAFALLALLACAMAGASTQLAKAAGKPGTLKTGFGANGRSLLGFDPAPDSGSVTDLAVRADGSTVVLGRSQRNTVVASYGPDGTPESAFSESGYRTNLSFTDGKEIAGDSLTVQPDGKSLIGGSTGPFSDGTIVRLNRDGSLDRGFGSAGFIRTDHPVSGIDLDQSGRIVVVTNMAQDTEVSRYKPDGSPDPSFAQNGRFATKFGKASGIYGVSTAGQRITVWGPGGVLRLTFDGVPDNHFGYGGELSSGSSTLAIEPDGSIVMVEGGQIRRLLPDGTPDTGFATGGTFPGHGAEYRAIAVDPAGRVLAAGHTPAFGSILSDFEITRLTPDGQRDPAFGNGGTVTENVSGGDDSIADVISLPGGKILVGGDSQPPGFGLARFSLARYGFGGQLDPGFGDGGILSVAPPMPSADRAFDAATTRDGGTIVVGKAGLAAGIASFLPGGKPDRGFGKGGKIAERFTGSRFGDVAESVAVSRRGELIVCVSSSEGTSLVRYLADGDRDPSFGENGVTSIAQLRHCGSTLIDRSGRVVIAGIDLGNVPHLVRLDRAGRIDLSFGRSGVATGPAFSPSGGGTRPVRAALSPDGDIVLAGDRMYAQVVRFTADGRLDRTFGNRGATELRGSRGIPFLGQAFAVEVTRKGRILVGGVSRKEMAVAALSPKGEVIRKFGVKGLASRSVLDSSQVRSIDARADGSFVAGGVARADCPFSLQPCRQTVILSFRPDGRADRDFGKRGMFTRKFGTWSEGAGVLTGRKGITFAGTATSPTERGEFMIGRLRP